MREDSWIDPPTEVDHAAREDAANIRGELDRERNEDEKQYRRDCDAIIEQAQPSNKKWINLPIPRSRVWESPVTMPLSMQIRITKDSPGMSNPTTNEYGMDETEKTPGGMGVTDWALILVVLSFLVGAAITLWRNW